MKRERNGCVTKKKQPKNPKNPELQREVQTPGFRLTSTQLVGHGVKCVWKLDSGSCWEGWTQLPIFSNIERCVRGFPKLLDHLTSSSDEAWGAQPIPQFVIYAFCYIFFFKPRVIEISSLGHHQSYFLRLDKASRKPREEEGEEELFLQADNNQPVNRLSPSNCWTAPLRGYMELLLTYFNASLASWSDSLLPSLLVAWGWVAMAPSRVFMPCMTMSVMSVARA